ncbi:ATP-dependent RecD-like DNA helicase [Clostridium algidicarnis]|uniref:SF1B family DNA helicase RecD2 n=1 Tax=Clostridium algidicarnis TaxID=37659 RepID=UPI001C0BF46B|nr:ATP-dependent RecD-like DNA helicase [Clostridium algidicarnis]MBU3195074.1 ATP-dependent RecD-like DNA helicase [Clostridium algidicarnis]
MEEIQVTVEDIIFKNEDNGYVVARVDEKGDDTVIVGCIPYISEGQNLKLKGEWTLHKQFGKQFKVNEAEEILPNSLIGIERYLSSGVILGIGPVTAKKIVDKFGEKTFEVLENDIDRLSEIEGIGEKKIELIYDSYFKQREVKNIMVFLQTYGVTPNQCMKIYKRFGAESISIIKNNPYILTEEVSGIGFKSADKIARSLGIEIDSEFRVQSGIKHVVNQFCALGNTYMPKDELIKGASEILTVKEELIIKNIFDCVIDGKVRVELIDGVECVFTLPYYYAELGITKSMLSIVFSSFDAIDVNIDKQIKEFEQENNMSFAISQKEAIKGVIDNGVEIITGGPGTGKTTIIKCIIDIFDKNGMSVVMAAPTGRAAKRMTESTGREAKTIHRLLELGFGLNDEEMAFSKGEESPLECDVIIIDEASMIDVLLMNNLLKALSLGTRLIIVGDVDQLPSVGAGNVLKDLIESECVKVVRLKEIFRQAKESMIVVNAHKINNGEIPILNDRDKDFFFIKEENKEKILNTVVELINTRLPQYNESWNKQQHIQILSPMKKGPLGIINLNSKLQEVLNPKAENKKEKEYRSTIFRVGDKVMQTKNNYSLKWIRVDGYGDKEGLGVFNGDMGFIQNIDEEDNTLTVIFDEEREVIYENINIDELDLAYAITIHKSQGSEFPVVIMPIFVGSPLLMNRNLLYTAITRAKNLVVLTGSVKALKYMVQNDRSFERFSSLKWRMKDTVSNEIFNEQ